MSENMAFTRKELIELATNLTASYLQANATPLDQVETVMSSFFQMLLDLNRSCGVFIQGRSAMSPAVPVEESVKDNYIVCLEDGKRLKMLKRHLSTVYSMSLDQYKERWGLDANYPTVAPNYARRRSDIAKTSGLGKTGRKRKIRVHDSGAAVLA
jgi:predicted transcriptional regulator